MLPFDRTIRDPGAVADPTAGDVEVVVLDETGGDLSLDPSGAVTIEHPDGSVTIDMSGRGAAADEDEDGEDDHFANLADKIPPDELARIADDLLRGIAADEESRKGWLDGYAAGVELLGLDLTKKPATGDTAPLEGMSVVDHPLLLEAVLRFWANAQAELLPSAGPVKVRDDATASTAAGPSHNGGPPLDAEPTRDELAEALEKDMNRYLTVTAREYVPDTRRMLFRVGLAGSQFKKIYRCPLRRRPVSESVDIKDIIVNNAATDLWSAGRVTHAIRMRPSVLKRMQIAGAYREVELSPPPPPMPNAGDQAVAQSQGVNAVPTEPEDIDHEIYECAAELDVLGYEHREDDEKGEPTGLQIPWLVTIEKASRQVLAIRRNWEPGDPFCLPINRFVHFPFVPGLGFYAIGLAHILGNTTKALTAALRIGLDSGMFANFPGFLYLASALRGNRNSTFRIPPGGGAPIESQVDDIRKAVLELPYKDLSPGFAALVDKIAQDGQRLGGTATMQVGEGRQDAPVGTTLALLEQATKVMDAVHKGLHQAQGEEFQLLRDELRADPSVLWRHKRSELRKFFKFGRGTVDDKAADEANKKIIQALDDYDLVPVADPNTPSHMHRIMKVVAVKQMQAANPAQYDSKKVDEWALKMIGVTDPDHLFAPPAPASGPPQPTPDKVLETQSKAQIEAAKIAAKDIADQRKYADAEKERAHERDMEIFDTAQTLAIHPEATGTVEQMISPQSRTRVI